ncbi:MULTISPECIES: metal ABC transporter permease [unclassified Granulicatella]|uniref:metal ABC transporter permease n=1 Tax=unclassified Granulicatella TaxID=2630493 RepID=UPI0010738315|nr:MULTISPECIES: metal ABC transporter permease [unclassified Granulicatella]MBF0779940.1 metal ABC transporter permease [Granulicatella sp. 19428wC4_WM01]TFU95957.1 metal ABC transporter permease [Granulicatella sp. WM01]
MEMFQYDFMQRAFVAALCIAVMAPIIGLLLLLRRQSLLADTLSHISLSGVALGLILHVSPTLMTMVIVVVAAVLIEYLRQVYKSYSEVSVAILMATGLAVALLLMHLKPVGANSLKVEQYLFGSLVIVSSEQVVILVGLAFTIALLYSIFKRPLYVLLFDEDTAYTTGLPVRLMSVLFTVIVGLAISVMMPIAGALLVASILILPTAIAMRFAKNFTSVILWAMMISIVGMFGGLYTSYHYDTPPGATITLLFVCILIGVTLIMALYKWLVQNKEHQKNMEE